MNGKYYIGTDLKFKVTVTAGGFDQEHDEYKIDLYCGGTLAMTITQDDIVENGGDYYMLVPTSSLSPGPLRMVLTAYVPDTDFASGIRKEVVVQNLAVIKSVM